MGAVDFRITQARARTPLLDAPGGKQVAVAPAGAAVRGLVELVREALWLRVDLAPNNPLRASKGLETVWAPIAAAEEPHAQLIEWAGPLDVELRGDVLEASWSDPWAAVPLVGSQPASVSYVLEARPEQEDGADWQELWRSDRSSPSSPGARFSASTSWPLVGTDAAVRLAAICEDHGAGPAAPGSRTRRLLSKELAVDAGISYLRSLDKGVPHMRKIRSELGILVRKSEKNGGSDPEQLQKIEEYRAELKRAQDGRATILRRAATFVPRIGEPLAAARRVAALDGLGRGGQRRRPAQAAKPPPAAAAGRAFRKALVMGLYHSCTNAIQKELEKRFDVEVVNDWHTGKEGSLWKHRVNARGPPAGLDSETLVVLMVKEPHFWIRSCSREPRNFFELQPFRVGAGGLKEDIPEKSKTLGDLFGPLEHDSVIYPDAIGLWNDTVRSYFDDAVYPADQAVIIRSEDFLFRFHEVMDELAHWGLRDRETGARPEPLADRAKGHFECRTRDQALKFYAKAENRVADFSDAQLRQLARGLDPDLLRRLAYDGDDPVATWLPPAG